MEDTRTVADAIIALSSCASQTSEVRQGARRGVASTPNWQTPTETVTKQRQTALAAYSFGRLIGKRGNSKRAQPRRCREKMKVKC